MESRCVECGEKKDDPDEFTDGLRCTVCCSKEAAHEKACFVRRSNGRLDLIHAGRPSEAAMQARQAAFLLKHPGHERREFNQKLANMIKYRNPLPV